MINREVVGAILSSLMEIAIPSSKKQNISIYVSWIPKFLSGANENLVAQAAQVEPIFVLPSVSTDSSYSVSQQIEQKMALFSHD